MVALLLRMTPRVLFLVATIGAIVVSVPATLIDAPSQVHVPASSPRLYDEIQAAQWVQAHTPLRTR